MSELVSCVRYIYHSLSVRLRRRTTQGQTLKVPSSMPIYEDAGLVILKREPNTGYAAHCSSLGISKFEPNGW